MIIKKNSRLEKYSELYPINSELFFSFSSSFLVINWHKQLGGGRLLENYGNTSLGFFWKRSHKRHFGQAEIRIIGLQFPMYTPGKWDLSLNVMSSKT